MTLTKEAEERMLKVIEEIPQDRLQGMNIAMNASYASGNKEGMLEAGKYKGYWKEENDKATLFAIIREEENLEDYYAEE